MVSWKSADASMSEIVWDDYIAAQVDAIDTVRAALDVPAVHTIGYCVAGTTLAATLAMLSARGEAEKVKSVTFFTAQVDFEHAGDLKMFVDDSYLALLQQLSAPGFLDGRYMAATFNSLRGRDLIWNYVVSNYLLGNDYPPFDLLYWNGDTTNLPAKWHRQYLVELYRDNRLVIPNSLSAMGTPIDLKKIETPAFIQAGREDHIAPLASVWRLMDHLSGPKTFLLAGSGHIAGVVNPPAAGKYQYWTGDSKAATLDEFVAGAEETKGSWWPHWIDWISQQDSAKTTVKGARIPGNGLKKGDRGCARPLCQTTVISSEYPVFGARRKNFCAVHKNSLEIAAPLLYCALQHRGVHRWLPRWIVPKRLSKPRRWKPPRSRWQLPPLRLKLPPRPQ